MTAVIVIYLLVYSRHNSLSPVCGGILCVFLSVLSFSAQAIDFISIDIGQISADSYEIEDIHIEAKPAPDGDRLLVQANAQFLNQPIRVDVVLGQKQWQAKTKLKATAKELATSYQKILSEKPDWQYEGLVTIDLTANGSYQKNSKYDLKFYLRGQQLTGEYTNVSLASESVDLSIHGRLHGRLDAFSGRLTTKFNQGIIALGDLIIEPAAGPILFKSSFSYATGWLTLSQGLLHDPGGLKVNILKSSIKLQDLDQHEAEIHIESARFPHMYTAWLQPLLYGTVFEELEIVGQISASIAIHDKTISKLEFQLTDLSMADRSSRFSIYGMNGTYSGTHALAQGELRISYENAELHRLLIGGTTLSFNIKDYNARLVGTSSIPLYDGELKVFGLSFDNMNAEYPVVTFNGVLTPIDLSSLTHDLGWQSFSGSLSGVIPSVRYRDQVLEVDGILLARAFDGSFRIKDLRIENFLGVAPALSADFEIEDLDLEQLTRTFDFGRIEGKLSGYINNMQMLAWQPSSFDAFFYTPDNDESRHVISQRAVDNLTSLSGSDIGSILSRTYLRFLENFRYKKLGIGCVLKNNICSMRGVAPAQGSAYYIVKSGFFPPRLDIIGYSHEVDWADLVGRLKRVLSDNAPVIQ